MPVEKPEIFSGFLRFSPFSSLFQNSDFSANKKMPIGVLVLRTRNEPLWHLPWSRCHSYIRLRRVLLLRSGIRLSPSDIRYASLGANIISLRPSGAISLLRSKNITLTRSAYHFQLDTAFVSTNAVLVKKRGQRM